MSKKFQIFISSTFTDLAHERQEAIKTVLDLGHIPAGMEMFPAADTEQLKYITKIIDECDYYLLIIGGRYGSMDAAGVSFTEKEYDYAVDARKTVLAFIHGDPGSISVSKSDTTPAIAAKLAEFRKKVSNGRIVQFWKTADELKYKFGIALMKAFGDAPAVGWIRGDTAASGALLAQINDVRIALDNAVKENRELKAGAEPHIPGIAGLEEKFPVRYRHQIISKRTSQVEHAFGEVELTWLEIFHAASTVLMQPSTPEAMFGAILKYIIEDHGLHALFSLTLFDTDLNQIKIQLLALGFIVSETNVFGERVSITPHGKRQLLEIMAIRTKGEE